MGKQLNYNGTYISESSNFLNTANRNFLFGDGVIEFVRVINNTVVYAEEHYFNLMASMRILRMEIPMLFTLEFIEEEILNTISANKLTNCLVKLTVFRSGSKNILPDTNTIEYVVEVEHEIDEQFQIQSTPFIVEIFKDFYVSPDLLSSLTTANNQIGVSASIFANENGYNSCFILNTAKQVIGCIEGSLFMVKGTTVQTPPIIDGCKNTIFRKKIIEVIKADVSLNFVEASISPFDLQKADELFISNIEFGIQPITKYRKKKYQNRVSEVLIGNLNTSL